MNSGYRIIFEEGHDCQ